MCDLAIHEPNCSRLITFLSVNTNLRMDWHLYVNGDVADEDTETNVPGKKPEVTDDNPRQEITNRQWKRCSMRG